jgi:hypothetical protein
VPPGGDSALVSGIWSKTVSSTAFVLQHFLCIRHRPALMLRSLLGLLGVLSLSAPVLELRMRRLGASAGPIQVLGGCPFRS